MSNAQCPVHCFTSAGVLHSIMSKQFWDDRYSKEAFAYGEGPNEFLKTHLHQIKPGKILFPAEGEGRNAVYAASLGWDATAFDITTAGSQKANILSSRHGVFIDYQICSALDFEYEAEHYDVVALVYAHFPTDIKLYFHDQVTNCLKPGGMIILEAFSLENLEYQKVNPYVGGPSDPGMLYTVDEIVSSFPLFESVYLKQEVVELHEGVYHNGIGSVIRYVGVKKEKPSE